MPLSPRGHTLHRRLLFLSYRALVCLRMFEVQELMLDSGGKIFMAIGCGIDPFKRLIEVLFFVDPNGAFVEI